VPRSINPQINATVILENVRENDRLRFELRDQAWLQESHLGGFGPRDVASASLPVEDFDGWMELRPVVELPNNGWPVMQLTVKVRPSTSWPSEGFAGDRVALFEVDAGQAISADPLDHADFLPTAPVLEPFGVPQHGDAAGYRGFGVAAADALNRGCGVAAASSSTEDFRWQTFHIDPRAWTFAKKGELCQLLARMSMRPPVVSSR